jgi:hypothetical protein
MASLKSTAFPDVLECESSDPVLRGQYRLVPTAGTSSYIHFVAEPNNHVVYLYSRVGSKSVCLVYCEGVPELLPGDIWETVIADALSRHAAANMSVAVRKGMSDQVCSEICSEIRKIATEVSRDLVGWLIVSAGTSHMLPLARCIQRLPDEPHLRANLPGPVEISNASWEVREALSSKPSVPEWISRGLDAGWVALVTQTGLFKKDERFILAPASPPPVVTQPIPLSAVRRLSSLPTVFESPIDCSLSSASTIVGSAGRFHQLASDVYEWRFAECSSALDRLVRDAYGIESMPFGQQLFALEVVPVNDSGLISLTVRRKERRGSVRFKIRLGAGQSGAKVMMDNAAEFSIVLDPRSVFNVSRCLTRFERVEYLRGLSLTIEFVPAK